MNGHQIENIFADVLGGPTPTVKPNSKVESPHEATRIPSDWLTESELAEFWQVSSRQVRKLLSGAVIEKIEGSRFSRTDATRAYLRHLVASAKLRNGADPELKAEKLRIAKEQADLLELKNATARGEMVPAKQVESEWAGILRDIRAGLLAVSSRVGSRIPALTPHDLAEIDSEIRAVLKEIANADA